MPAGSTINVRTLASLPEVALSLDLLANLTGMLAGFRDPETYEPILDSAYDPRNVSPLCGLILSVSEGKQLCAEGDKKRCEEAARSGRPVCYECHAGLIDMDVPIFHEGRLVALISSGQFLPSPPSEEGLRKFLRSNRHLRLDPVAVRDAYYKAPYLPREKIETMANFLVVFGERLCAVHGRVRDEYPSREPRKIALARHCIQEHFQDSTLGLTDVAEHVGLSRSYFSTCFAKAVGSGFSKYLQKVRIEHACKLLETSSLSVTAVALESGFNTLSQFHRVFRELKHCSPREYRKRRRSSGVSRTR